MFKKLIRNIAITGAIIIGLGVTTPIDAASCDKALITGGVNVRTGASTRYRKVGYLSKGKVVTVLSKYNGWYKISSNGTVGWSSGKYVDVGESGASTANVNIRSGASTRYRKVGYLTKGKSVSILDSYNGWYKIYYNGTVGWSSGKYIRKTSSSTSTKPSTPSTSIKPSTPSTSNKQEVKKTLRVRAVAYTGGGYTALGTKVRYGVLAVDPRIIPYRSKVYIKELDKVFIAEDCGGGIKGNVIDIYMPTKSACYNWGSRYITIQILK